MLDFLFRRGNPTNAWHRTPHLNLKVDLAAPSLNGIALGSQFNQLSFLGRSDVAQNDSFCYFDLGVGVAQAKDGTLHGFTIVFSDENQEFQPYCGTLSWKHDQLEGHQLTREDLPSVFGDWYWLDTDDDESIAFYEYPEHEMQIELTLTGAIQRIILTKSPLMADPDQREFYNVDKPWPPHFGT